MGIYENARKQTKEKIMNAFWELYKEHLINKITVKQITDMCGIHRGTFYLYFQDIYEVLEKLEALLLGHLDQAVEHHNQTGGNLTTFGKSMYDLFQQSCCK